MGTADSRTASPIRDRKPSVLWAVGAGLVLGTALGCLGPWEYRCVAFLSVVKGTQPSGLDRHREQLQGMAWNRTTDGPYSIVGVETETPSGLRLIILTDERETGPRQANDLVNQYNSRLAAKRAETMSVVSDDERVLSQWAEELERRLDGAQEQVQTALSKLPMSDPRQLRDTLFAQWREHRRVFEESRKEFDETVARLAELRAEPEPKHGIVPGDQRQQALTTDAGLQQDLREITVKIAEIRLQLLLVWQKSAAPLDQLSRAVQSMLLILGPGASECDSAPTRDSLKALQSEVLPYQSALEAFTENWNREFAAIKQSEPDPLSGDLVDVHSRVRTLLNDFLYATVARLSELRTQIQGLAAIGSDQARYHVLHSEVIRTFQAVQSAHHRFEFTAGALEPRDNFRLDSALESARGLRRRTQQRIRTIDERLQASALEGAKKRRSDLQAELEREMERHRAKVHQSIAEIVRLQEQLNVSSEVTEGFLRNSLTAELAHGSVQIAESDLARTQEQLGRLAKRRLASAVDDRLELLRCDASAWPANLGFRIRQASLAAVLTAMAVYFAQRRAMY